MIITYPDSLLAAKLRWGQMPRDASFQSSFGSQSVETALPLLKATVTPKRFNHQQYAEWETLLLKLQGRKNQLALWNLARPAPQGTMRGAMTLNVAVAQGSSSLTITAGAGQAATTLLAGDLLGLGSGTTQQVVKVLDNATADAGGIITVAIDSALRNAFIIGAAVTWDKPKALFRRRTSETNIDYTRAQVDGEPLELIEDWRP